MRDAVICAAVRTPVGRRKGALKDVHAVDLGAVVLRARKGGPPRAQVDEFSVGSHAKTAAAQEAGLFDDELVPVPLPGGGTFDRDEGVRPDSTLDTLAGLKLAFRPDGVVTAGNS